MFNDTEANTSVAEAAAGPAFFQQLSECLAERVPSPPAYGLREFVATLPAKPDRCPDRRRFRRCPLLVDVNVLPLDDALRPMGQPFTTCCRNLSSGGICLYHDAQLECEHLYLEIKLGNIPPMQAVMSVLRQKPAGPFVEIAGSFINVTDATKNGRSQLPK